MFSKQDKTKISKKAQMDEELKTASSKVDAFYKELHSINIELKAMTEHEAKITNPNQKQFTIIGDLTLIRPGFSVSPQARGGRNLPTRLMNFYCPIFHPN